MTDLFAEAMITFRDLLDAARASGDPEPTAMTLATRGEQDRLAARTVLLKAHDDRGFVFYTNTRSRKGEDLAAHPSAALLFHWKHLRHGVQVRIEGAVQPVTDDEADRYFASRPRMSQIGAWASDQSRTLDRRETFEARIAEIEQRFAAQAVDLDHTDGLSMQFDDWRFNLRMSNTEPVVRLNVESRGDAALMEAKTAELLALIDAPL